MKNLKSELTQEYLKECLDYNPENGILTWKVRPRHHFGSGRGYKMFNTRFPGKETGCKGTEGYLSVAINGKLYKAHRLAWLWVTGSWPKDQTDHRDHDRTNNRWLNLREATGLENSRNQSLHFNNTSGVAGVRRSGPKWQVSIKLEDRHRYLGCFVDWFDAVCARKSAEHEYGYHPNHGRVTGQ